MLLEAASIPTFNGHSWPASQMCFKSFLARDTRKWMSAAANESNEVDDPHNSAHLSASI
jgi:hypothetical protein